jgi:heterodisulfide reductase subunit B
LIREIGWDKVKERVRKPLEGLKVAPYYGCLLLRPRGVGIDNVDNPTIMEDFLATLGCQVVDFSLKQKCCGSYHTVQMKEAVADLSHRIIRNAVYSGAEAIATACPLCEYNLGLRQSLIEEFYPNFESLPVVYFTQLMALAFGLGEESTVFTGNNPDPRPLFQKKGFVLGGK